MSSWSPPSAFEEYRLLREIGRGGMGMVFLAHDTLLDRRIAIKFIAGDRAASRRRERFLVEARAAARLQHPNVVAVHRVGQYEDRPYLVAEFVEGVSLRNVDKPMPWRRALDYGIGLARGLAAAHREGVLHRDIKPANAILTDDGEVKLLDFGLAKLSNVTAEAAPSWPDASSDSVPTSALPPAPAIDRGDTQTASDIAEPPSELPAPALTRAGAVMGTPYYMPPEIWRGDPATRRSDVYSLGALLFELCAGRPPHGDVGRRDLERAVVDTDAPPLSEVALDVDARFAAVVDRCLERDPDERFSSGDQLREALEALRPGARPPAPDGNPYRGLHRFEAEHRAVFFGRASEIRDVVERLRADAFVLVTGDSGVGKSSLCRAGVLPGIADDGLGDGREWTVTRIVPGTRPMSAIASALSGDLPASVDDVQAADVVREARLAAGDRGVLLFVDQLEELLTLADEREAALAAEVIAHIAAGVPGMRVLATARCDFLSRLAGLPNLGEWVSRALYLLRPLTPAAVRDIIVAPARAKGVELESDALVDELARAAEDPGGLPLLEFALAELWQARGTERGIITHATLDDIGGVSGALARHADAAIAEMLPGERSAVRQILARLVTADGTRARRTAAELCDGDSDAEAALDALVRARLVAAYGSGGDREASYEVAHEALLSGWDTLRDWLDERAELRAVHDRLQTAAAEWSRLGRARDALWSRKQCGEAAALADGDINATEREFLAASRRAARRRVRLRWGIAVAIPLVAALTYGALWLQSTIERGRAVDARLRDARAQLAEADAEAAAVDDLRARSFAAFDARTEDAERLRGEALGRARDLDRRYRRAAQALEAAFTIDPERTDVRHELARALYRRALLAERNRRADQVEELLQRIELHDDTGRYLAQWTAPARVSIATEPAGATVALARFERPPQQRYEAVDRRELGAAPIAPIELEPGSYILELTLDGRVDVRAPFVAARGERLDLTIPLPPADAVPDGFVYVPAGPFMLGYSGPESLRRGFFKTAPIHRVDGEAFLIARHETTIAEYIEYLEAHPVDRWPDLLPGEGSSNIRLSDQDLSRVDADTWQLSLEPTSTRYTVRTGEPLVYEGRRARARQDWTRFPIGGLKAAQVERYAAWLASSGRVPGARLCTEREWTHAARGADSRVYPHGDGIGPDHANYDKTYGQLPEAFGPDEVGSHPLSDSPFGVKDMAGNVYEITRSSISDDPYAVLGGNYYQSEESMRISNRETPEPSFAHASVGFRICADL